MEKWSTQLHLKTNKGLMQSKSIKINREIFQDDSLSLLIFSIVLIPLILELNRSKCGYQIYGAERKINMDDLKLLEGSKERLRNEIRIITTISNNIKLESGLGKCARSFLRIGKVHKIHITQSGD